MATDAGCVHLSSGAQEGCSIADPGRLAEIKCRQAHPGRVEEPEFGASAGILIGGLLGDPLDLTSERLELFALAENLAVAKGLLKPGFEIPRGPRGIMQRLHCPADGNGRRLTSRTERSDSRACVCRTDDKCNHQTASCQSAPEQ